MEIERKWIVSTVPVDENTPRTHIRQGYVTTSTSGAEVRLRAADDNYILTVKSEGDLVRDEFEVRLTQEQFEVLWPSTGSRRIEKTRYSIYVDSYEATIDVYSGAHAGLVIAEIEFAERFQASAFTSPNWFGREVTYDSRYKNRNLASSGGPPKS